MAKWMIFVFFWICMVMGMQKGQLWTWFVLIPVFTVLYNYAEWLEDDHSE